MGLLETLKGIKDNGFDAKTDKINSSRKLEAGTYPVRLKSVQAGVSKFGQVQIGVSLEVISGKFKDRQELLFLSFDEKLSEFVLEKNGKILLKLAAMVDVELKKSDVEDEYTTASALEKGVGRQFNMTITTSPNKNNPASPYRNYDFEPLESQEVEVFEEELPF